MAAFDGSDFDLVLSDINMGGISGLELVPHVLERSPQTVVVMISGQQGIETAIAALQAGAFDYITKPFDLRHVEAAVRRALEQRSLLLEKRQYETNLEELVKQRTAQVERLAYYDTLTGLPNRVLFADRLDQALTTAQRNQQVSGILLVSIDRFKKINDTLGHALGDLLLKEVGQRLQSCLRKGDTVARFEGEEFAVLLMQVAATDELAETGQIIDEALKPSFVLAGHEVYLTASIGISLFPYDGDDGATILQNAGAALYRAKTQGGNNYQFYTADMNSRALKRLSMETSLRGPSKTIFVLYYQPQIIFASGTVVGAEALIRWHPDLGLYRRLSLFHG